MSDEDVLGTINRLATEEHELFQRASAAAVVDHRVELEDDGLDVDVHCARFRQHAHERRRFRSHRSARRRAHRRTRKRACRDHRERRGDQGPHSDRTLSRSC